MCEVTFRMIAVFRNLSWQHVNLMNQMQIEVVGLVGKGEYVERSSTRKISRHNEEM